MLFLVFDGCLCPPNFPKRFLTSQCSSFVPIITIGLPILNVQVFGNQFRPWSDIFSNSVDTVVSAGNCLLNRHVPPTYWSLHCSAAFCNHWFLTIDILHVRGRKLWRFDFGCVLVQSSEVNQLFNFGQVILLFINRFYSILLH